MHIKRAMLLSLQCGESCAEGDVLGGESSQFVVVLLNDLEPAHHDVVLADAKFAVGEISHRIGINSLDILRREHGGQRGIRRVKVAAFDEGEATEGFALRTEQPNRSEEHTSELQSQSN